MSRIRKDGQAKMISDNIKDPIDDGTRVFVRSESVFGDTKSRMGIVGAWHMSLDKDENGEPQEKLEYLVVMGVKAVWVPKGAIEGFLKAL